MGREAGDEYQSHHELHRRRFGRNLGVGLILAGFIALVFGLTVVKVQSGAFAMKPQIEAGNQ